MQLKLANRLGLTLLLLTVAACRTELPSPPKATRSSAPAATTPAATPAAAAKPAILRKPAGESTELTGQVNVDPLYMTSVDAGKVISNDGSSVVVAGDALIGQDGAGLIGQDGAGLVAQGGGNVISNDGSSLVAQGGGNLASDGVSVLAANGLISQDGAGLIGQDGAGLVAQGGGNFHLLADEPAAGTQLPAAGMAVSAYSLASERYLPLGVGPDGKPVYTIYSDAHGQFKVFLAPDDAAEAMLVASVPGSRDFRLTYNMAFGSGVLDEDSTQVTKLARLAFVERLRNYLAASDKPTSAPQPDQDPGAAAFLAATDPFIPNLVAAARANKLSTADPAVQRRLAQRLASRLMPSSDRLAELSYDDKGTTRPVFEGLTQALRDVRLAAAAHPEARDALNQLARDLGPTWTDPEGIKKPSDAATLLALVFSLDPMISAAYLDRFYKALGLSRDTHERIDQPALRIMFEMGLGLAANPTLQRDLVNMVGAP